MRYKLSILNEDKVNINLVPYIDIIFNLFLFALLTSSLVVQHTALTVQLPTAAHAGDLNGQAAVTVDLTRDGAIFVDGKRALSFDELKERLRGAYAQTLEKPLLIRADAMAQHGNVVAILDLARELGVKSLNVETLPEVQKKGGRAAGGR